MKKRMGTEQREPVSSKQRELDPCSCTNSILLASLSFHPYTCFPLTCVTLGMLVSSHLYPFFFWIFTYLPICPQTVFMHLLSLPRLNP